MVLLVAAREALEAAVLVERQHSLGHHASGTAVRVGRRVALVATAEVTAGTVRLHARWVVLHHQRARRSRAAGRLDRAARKRKLRTGPLVFRMEEKLGR